MTFLTREMKEHVLTLTMSSPDTRNALTSDDQFEEFESICVEINDNKAIRAVVLTGEGSAFCAGGNVKDMRERKGLFSGDPFDQTDAYRKGIQRIPRAIYSLNVPIIAAVNGPAVGAGCDLATMCDIRIGTDKTMFAESFVKLGIIPGDGGAWFLPRAVGYSNACKMAFTGEPIRAQEALTMGLISEIVETERLVGRAQELAASIAQNPPHAVRLTKQLMRASEKSSLDELLDKSAAFQAVCHAEADHVEAVEAFFEKRPGNYRET
ncbi:crotonase/enoyl-CoA hydratase family protein [Gammaproteobacteria bacterium]|nr:crotonase/enoyl-CoA hydratase family protein [Gammaproteobacteria bacterium]